MTSDQPGSLRITQTLEPRGPAAALVLDDAQLAHLGGGRKTPPVRVTVNGHTFHGRIGRMGGETLLGFNKAVREACGVTAGEEIEALVVVDDAPPELELPDELAAALAGDPEARAALEGLALSRREEAVRSIADAKRSDTRERQLAELMGRLRE